MTIEKPLSERMRLTDALSWDNVYKFADEVKALESEVERVKSEALTALKNVETERDKLREQLRRFTESSVYQQLSEESSNCTNSYEVKK